MTRARLPNRRAAETVALAHAGTRFTVTVGFYPDGRIGEVFTHGARSGSNLDALLADACVVVSCLIQHGAELRELAASMGRLGNAEPASIIGAVIDLAAVRGGGQCHGGGRPMNAEAGLLQATALLPDVTRRPAVHVARARASAGSAKNSTPGGTRLKELRHG